MILINFAHPITSNQRAQIESLAGEQLSEIYDIAVHFDFQAPFIPQVQQMLDQVGMTSAAWQEKGLLINLPSFNIIAAALLAELHGRLGHFPAVLLVRTAGGPITQYEVAEIINLQAIRDASRAGRYSENEKPPRATDA